jgi:hypothetical protein
MADDPSHRVSDDDRDRVVVELREHLLAGRLTLEEFSARVETALRARVGRDLVLVQQDLPQLYAPRPPDRKPDRYSAAFFGHVVRRGRVRLRGRTAAVSVFADLDLDLREATIEEPDTTVTVLAVCGNVDVYVPEAVNVVVGGVTVFGHRREWGRDVVRPGAPTVHVRVVGCCGTVDVWRVPSDVRGDYGEVLREVRRRQLELPG